MLDRVIIEKFRNFRQNQEVKLGSRLTVISGQNGTLKTSFIGAIAQCFAWKNDIKNIFDKLIRGNERQIFKGDVSVDFINQISIKIYQKDDEKFSILDQDGNLHYSPFAEHIFIERKDKGKTTLRHWTGRQRSKGVGKKLYPVAFLGMERLWPLAESSIKIEEIELTEEEKITVIQIYNQITGKKLSNTSFSTLVESRKRTLGLEEDSIPAIIMSSGKDVISQIIAHLLSFFRIQHDEDYKGGLFIIDEIEASLHPDYLMSLVQFFSTQNIIKGLQVIFTTHNFDLLNHLSGQKNKDNKLYYFWREEHIIDVKVIDTLDVMSIKTDLYLNHISSNTEMPIYIIVEDKRDKFFVEKLLASTSYKYKLFEVIDLNKGGSELLDFLLTHKKILSKYCYFMPGEDVEIDCRRFLEKKKSLYPDLNIPEQISPYLYFIPMENAPEKELILLFENNPNKQVSDILDKSKIKYSSLKQFLEKIKNDIEINGCEKQYKNQKGKYKTKYYKELLSKIEEWYNRVNSQDIVNILWDIWEKDNTDRIAIFKDNIQNIMSDIYRRKWSE